MSTMRTGVAAFAAAAVVAAVCVQAGCGAKRRAREAQAVQRTYAATSFVNQTDIPVRVSVVVGERMATPPGIGSSFWGQPAVVQPGGTYKAVIQETKPYGVGFLFPDNGALVVRFKLETAGATWEAGKVAWYEVVGPMPESIRLVPNDAGAPGVAVSAGRVEVVPREWWPAE